MAMLIVQGAWALRTPQHAARTTTVVANAMLTSRRTPSGSYPHPLGMLRFLFGHASRTNASRMHWPEIPGQR